MAVFGKVSEEKDELKKRDFKGNKKSLQIQSLGGLEADLLLNSKQWKIK